MLIKRKIYKRRYIQIEETLMVRKVSNFIAKRKGSSCNNSNMAAKRVRVSKHCRYYSKVRHNTRTYTANIEQLNNSNSSKE